ncbi:hypothetical protein ACJ72_05065 [Emergomyces africanus]|uniref:Uncharacterized protein n=1 Tax=Emergomyces africanus TaxID=1955775 RepID=A0A1B7NUZ1_9EURO|nr:hypothetical protein ACJ72_05581 [Emergomyces africanus]OAX80596.1 hypothetical protein ACJ72_05065 [Emergomyces africanus]
MTIHLEGVAENYNDAKYPPPEFAVDVEDAHIRMAKACLIYYLNESRDGASPTLQASLSSFHTVADDVLELLEIYLSKIVLSWIQPMAENGELKPLFNVSSNLSTYLDKLLEAQPLGETRRQAATHCCTKDLIRIPTKIRKLC